MGVAKDEARASALYKRSCDAGWAQSCTDFAALFGFGANHPNTAMPTTQDVPSFELEGDSLGESLSSFVSRHPQAQCLTTAPNMTSCYQWSHVSIEDMVAHPDDGCSPQKHSITGCAEGVTAQFRDDHLVLLSYAVEGMDKKAAVAKFKQKYGAPIADDSANTTWLSGNDMLGIAIGRATTGNDGPTLITFMVTRP